MEASLVRTDVTNSMKTETVSLTLEFAKFPGCAQLRISRISACFSLVNFAHFQSFPIY